MNSLDENNNKRNAYLKIIDDLTDVINAYEAHNQLFSCQGQAMDGYSALANFVQIAKKARELKTAMVDAVIKRDRKNEKRKNEQHNHHQIGFNE